MTGDSIRVLLVEDNPGDADLVRESMRDAPGDFELLCRDTLTGALDLLAENAPTIAVVDLSLPDASGLDTIRRIRGVAAEIPLIVLTGLSDDELALKAVQEGAQDYVMKGDLVIPGHLVRSIRYAIERHNLLREIQDLNRSLEQRVAERTAELESFTYSVSHDLRQPLRAIGSFTDLLLTHSVDALDDEARGYLMRIKSAGMRMADMIDGLLTLSRVSRHDLHLELVRLDTVARAIAAELQASDRERSVTFVIQPGLVAHADGSLLRSALQNLLANAWKFTARQREARIELGQTVHDGQTTFYVHDNGAGFDMTYADYLFQPFHRLHGHGEFEGTGIGLATVHRIMQRHGGRIWAEAAPGMGATFYFIVATDAPPAARVARSA